MRNQRGLRSLKKSLDWVGDGAKRLASFFNNLAIGFAVLIASLVGLKSLLVSNQLHSPDQVKRLIGLTDEKAEDVKNVLNFFLRNYNADRAFIWFYAKGERGEPFTVFKADYQAQVPGMAKIVEGKYEISFGVAAERYQKHQTMACTFYDATKEPQNDLLVKIWNRDTRYHLSCPFQTTKNGQVLLGAVGIESGREDFSKQLTVIETELIRAGSFDVTQALNPN